MVWEIEEEPTTFKDVAKDIARQPARVAEKVATRAVGLPGDVMSLVNDYIARPAQKLVTGKPGVPYEQTYLGKALPTTETHRKGIEEKTGEFFKPQNKIEQFVDDVVEDTALMFMPGGKSVKAASSGKELAKQSTKNLAKSIGANFLGEGAKEITGSETAGTATKAGALFVTSLLDTKAAAKQISTLYDKARSNLPPTATQNATKLSKDLDRFEHSITHGRPRSTLSDNEEWVMKQADKVRKLINGNDFNVDQMWAQKVSHNQELGQKIYQGLDKSSKKGLKNQSVQLNAIMKDGISDYGKKNPSFYKPFTQADEAFSTMAKSNWVTNWAENNIKNVPLTEGLMAVFGVPVSTVGAAVGYLPAKLIYRIVQSPTLKNIYGKAIGAAAREDSVAFNKYLKDLDSKMQEEEGKETWVFED